MPILYRAGPEVRVPRLSHDEPAQAMGPWTMCATSAIGSSAICAPSNEQPPAVAPGFGLAQPDLDLALCAQAGSLRASAICLAVCMLRSRDAV